MSDAEASRLEKSAQARRSPNRKSHELARREVRKGLSPVEILMGMARHYYDEWEAKPDKDPARLAMSMAEKAAPYMHPRMASIQNEHNVKGEITINIGGKTGDL